MPPMLATILHELGIPPALIGARGEVVVDVLKVCVPPGFSEHHSGCAVDLSVSGEVPLQPGFAQTPAYAWLTAHAADFDFYLSFPEGNPQGYAFEPWHWCHRPASAV